MSYTKRNVRTLSLLVTILVYVLFNFTIYKINQNTIEFQKSQVISLENPIEKNENLKNEKAEDKTEIKKAVNVTKIETPQAKELNTQKKEWRIQIPKINLDAPIAEGVTDEVIAETVGHFDESALWNGNVALAAHNRGYNCNFFEKIKTLKNGDIITYSCEQGVKKYKVMTNVVIKETDWSYVKNTKDNRITLITCEEDRSEYRRCIQGIEI